MKLSNLVITGATGMLGGHFLAACREEGIAAVGCSRSERAAASSDVHWVSWDQRQWASPDELGAIFGNPDAIVHAGAMNPNSDTEVARRDYLDANVTAALAIGEYALGADIPLVFISGATVYEDQYGTDLDESAPKTNRGVGGFYGFTKFLGEAVFDHLVPSGLRICILRPTSIYGFGMKGKVINHHLAIAAGGGAINVKPPFDDQVNFVHASDVVRAALFALRGEAWTTFNIPGPDMNTFVDLANYAVEVTGNGRVTFSDGKTKSRPLNRFNLSGSKAEREIGFTPKINLRRGLDLLHNGRFLL